MRKPLSQKNRERVDYFLMKGITTREVAKKMKISKGLVSKIAKEKGFQTKNKSGRKKILSERDEKFCAREITSGRASTAAAVRRNIRETFDVNASEKTISRALKNQGLNSAVKKKKPELSPKNIKARLQFAKTHQDWTLDDWKRVIWSDETKVNRFNSDGRTWFWGHDPSKLDGNSVTTTRKFGGGGIIVWGCMTSEGVGFCCKADSTIDQHLYREILEEELLQTIEWYQMDESKVIFQQDNASLHMAKSVQEWMSTRQFQTMIWPAQSPDLNPIEHLWCELKRRLNRFDSPPNGILQLWERVQEVWNSIPPSVCLNLIESMPRRIRAVLRAKGKWTKY